MRIGIDISQLAYAGTGVANYSYNIVDYLLRNDSENEYVLFFSSLRRRTEDTRLNFKSYKANYKIKKFKFPPSLLDLLWNKMHVLPIDLLVRKVDIFITSDWTEPPAKSKKATFIYDLTVYRVPQEMSKKIIKVQRRKLSWVKKESDIIFTISESSKKDIQEILKIDAEKIFVIYPGI